MPYIQPITHEGKLVAIVAGGQAIISEMVPSHELATVKAMCLYALEVADGNRPGPYTDAGALAYARIAAAARN